MRGNGERREGATWNEGAEGELKRPPPKQEAKFKQKKEEKTKGKKDERDKREGKTKEKESMVNPFNEKIVNQNFRGGGGENEIRRQSRRPKEIGLIKKKGKYHDRDYLALGLSQIVSSSR